MSFDPHTYAQGRHVLVRAHRLQRHYRRGVETVQALRGADLEIYRGEYLCIMGPSGSGKSTFFNLIGGLDTPTAGRVFLDEVDMAQLNARELAFLRCRKIGYIFQTYNLTSVMTALDNVMLPMIFAGVHTDEARQRALKLLDQVGLDGRYFHRPKELSGGQQQRVAIARALANRPALLLCDEPTANLDWQTGKEIHRILHDLNRQSGVTIVCSTHDHDMLAVSDRMIWLADGQIERIALSSEVTLTQGSLEARHV